MAKHEDAWDILAIKNFNAHLKPGEVDPRAADNILLAWPPIIRCITQNIPKKTWLSALDYGCGTGAFCSQLEQLGFTVTGIDTSQEMIRIATANTATSIRYVVGDYRSLPTTTKFGVVASIMTLQFVEDIEQALRLFTDSLEDNGLLIIAVFNPQWVKMCLDVPIGFTDFDSTEDPKVGWKTFGDVKVPVYIRNTDEYNSIAAQYHLVNVFEAYPPFTKEFTEQYPDNRPKDASEFLILGYKKKN